LPTPKIYLEKVGFNSPKTTPLSSKPLIKGQAQYLGLFKDFNHNILSFAIKNYSNFGVVLLSVFW
jgi:hypothetical protein